MAKTNRKAYADYKNNPDLTTGGLKDVANILGVTDRMVSNYINDKKDPLPIYLRASKADAGVFIRAHIFNLHDVFQWWLDRQLRDSYNDGDSEESINPKREQARLHKEKADGEAIKNAILRGEYAPITAIEDTLGSIANQINAILGALPLQLKRRYGWLTGKQILMIQKDITKTQNIVAKVRVVINDTDDDTDDGTDPEFLK